MSHLLAPFFGNLLLSAGIFLVLFFLISLLIARQEFPGLVGGILRSIASYFYSPFLYLRKVVAGLARYSGEGESRFVGSEQYLLQKLLLMLSAAIFLVAIGILTVGALQGTLHARQWGRLNKQIGIATDELTLARAEKARLGTHVAGLEDEWANHRDRLMAAYQKQRRRMADSMTTANTRLEQQAKKTFESDATASELFQSILNFMAGNSENPGWRWRQIRDQIQSAIDRAATTQENKDLMTHHNENWYQIRMTLIPPSELGAEELRRVVQPTLMDSMSRVQYLDQDIPRQESSLQGLRGEAKSEAKGILWKPLMAFLKFIAFIWGAGITLEALALAVLTAGNIQRLRENSDEGMPDPAAEGR